MTVAARAHDPDADIRPRLDMSRRSSTKTLLPAGMIDVLAPEAAFEAATIERLMAVFASHGYERVKPPLIEFEDTLLAGSGTSVAAQAFRLMDPVSHRMLALRPDMTMQVARIAADRLPNRPRPLRLAYAGQVVRVQGSQLRPARQFTQVGVEIVGTAAAGADAEVVTMAAAALTGLGFAELTIDLGMPALVPAMLRALGLDEEARVRLRAALDRKDAAAAAEVARVSGEKAAAAVAALPLIAGPAERALPALGQLPLDVEAAALREALTAVVAEIRRHRPPLTLAIDPVERRGFEYHCGVTFAIFAAGVRGELGRGGRYRATGGEQATGITLFMDTVLGALSAPPRPPRVFVPFGTSGEDVGRLHRQGWVTVSALEETADLDAEAVRLECGSVFDRTGLRSVGHCPLSASTD